MEVHHHPEVEKKGFKEYILEGLMIFLAVMMGFFAESIRENVTNREHAKQLTRQLVSDLKNDTVVLRENAAFESAMDKRDDSLFDILQQPLEKIDKKRMQNLILRAYSLKLFYPSLGAIAAIKNELHIKQFANSKIATYITNYEDRAKVLKELEDIEKRNLEGYIGGFLKDHFTPANVHTAFYDEKPIENGDMRDVTQKDMARFSVELTLIEGFNKDLISYDKKLQANAAELINYVKKQYGLEDE
ncbi:MAG TPA: hypothetical protein VFE54_10580 [Mucilaginibacter sp.]|jgi:hypothetical protein|nr:hypothetical protein [Mucilaginibacter sp.]